MLKPLEIAVTELSHLLAVSGKQGVLAADHVHSRCFCSFAGHGGVVKKETVLRRCAQQPGYGMETLWRSLFHPQFPGEKDALEQGTDVVVLQRCAAEFPLTGGVDRHTPGFKGMSWE